MDKVKKILLSLIVIVLIAAIVLVVINIVRAKVAKKSNPIVTMEIEGYGTIKIELYPDVAPNTVKNFIKLAQRDFYKGKTFSDIKNGTVRAGAVEESSTNEETGETTTKVTGPKLSNIKDLAEGEDDESYSIEGEFIENGYTDNTLSHQRGIVSMYRKSSSDYTEELAMVKMVGYEDYVDTLLEQMYDSQGSEFFILTKDDTSYNGLYTAFGRVIEGIEIIDTISNIELQKEISEDGTEKETTKPVTAPVISNVTVETFGIDYGEPETTDYFDFDSIFEYFMQSYMQSSGTTTTVP